MNNEVRGKELMEGGITRENHHYICTANTITIQGDEQQKYECKKRMYVHSMHAVYAYEGCVCVVLWGAHTLFFSSIRLRVFEWYKSKRYAH